MCELFMYPPAPISVCVCFGFFGLVFIVWPFGKKNYKTRKSVTLICSRLWCIQYFSEKRTKFERCKDDLLWWCHYKAFWESHYGLMHVIIILNTKYSYPLSLNIQKHCGVFLYFKKDTDNGVPRLVLKEHLVSGVLFFSLILLFPSVTCWWNVTLCLHFCFGFLVRFYTLKTLSDWFIALIVCVVCAHQCLCRIFVRVIRTVTNLNFLLSFWNSWRHMKFEMGDVLSLPFDC